MSRVAVILFNLGGPDGPEAVEPFLFNLFNDPAIIAAPGPIRWLLAKYIAKKRGPTAREIYSHLGGKSPLLELTEAQAGSLQARLRGVAAEVKVFVSMRYWHPMSDAVARDVAAYGPDRVVLLPLYPHYAKATTGSSLADWERAAAKAGVEAETTAVCCYPTQSNYIEGLADLVADGLAAASAEGRPRVLFSAHGLPKREIERGDPYQRHVEMTAGAVLDELTRRRIEVPDEVVCFQSRVGPLEWIGPSTDDEIKRAGRDGVPVVVVPIAFVSEHSETLVELDIEYRHLAESAGVPAYVRVPAMGENHKFIAGLAALVQHALSNGAMCCQDDARLCPGDRTRCPMPTQEGDAA